jgi:hypothetical protein
VYRARRRRLLFGVVVVLLLAHTGGRLLNDTSHVGVPPARTRTDDSRTDVSAVRWPLQGQAALVLGKGRPSASPGERPVPIASLAKVMTAYLTLKRYPLSGARDGFTLTITAAQAQAEGQEAREGQSGVFEQAMRFPVFRQIVSMPAVTLPVAGTLTNYNPLIADGYAGKTGSDSAAGGCLAFSTHVRAGGRRLTAVGVVLGQGHGSDTRSPSPPPGRPPSNCSPPWPRRPAALPLGAV